MAFPTTVYTDNATAAAALTNNAQTAGLSLSGLQPIAQIQSAVANLLAGSATGNPVVFTSGTSIVSPSDGVITLLNTAGTGFSRLQLGGTSSSFPAIKGSGASLQVRLADDSTYTSLFALQTISNGAATTVGAGQVAYGGTVASTVGAAGAASALPATPLGYLIINVAGTQAKLPYYNT